MVKLLRELKWKVRVGTSRRRIRRRRNCCWWWNHQIRIRRVLVCGCCCCWHEKLVHVKLRGLRIWGCHLNVEI